MDQSYSVYWSTPLASLSRYSFGFDIIYLTIYITIYRRFLFCDANMPGYTGHCLCGSCTIHIDHPHASSSSYDLQHVSCHCAYPSRLVSMSLELSVLGSDCQHTSGTSRTTSVLPKIEDVVMVGDIHQYHSKSAAGNTGESPHFFARQGVRYL